MAMYRFVHPFREAKLCGVPSCVFDKLGCAAGEKRLRNTGLEQLEKSLLFNFQLPIPRNRRKILYFHRLFHKHTEVQLMFAELIGLGPQNINLFIGPFDRKIHDYWFT
jgi:hypothetical protein